MLTGDRPEGTESLCSLRSEVPARLDEVFRRSYTRWDRRYASASDMLGALTATRQAPSAEPPQRVFAGTEAACPACREPVHRDDQFCIHCGHQLAASVPRCAACQAYAHPSDRFCIFCGNDLRVLT